MFVSNNILRRIRRSKYKHKHKWSLLKDNPERKIKISYKKVIFFAAFVLCLTFIGLSIITNKNLNKTNKVDPQQNQLNIEESINNNTLNTNESNFNFDRNLPQTTISKNFNVTNIALLGIDEPEGSEGRSDCIIILTIDNTHNVIKLSSIIRDSYVTIPTKDKKDKINHAYAFGGPKLAIKTLNENFNLDIDKFITVNFTSLPKIIDKISGITLNLSDDELKYINGYITDLNNKNGSDSPFITTPGEQLVNGTQALAYCRIRYTDGGDFERSHRHRTVLTKVFEKSKSIPVTNYPSLLDEVLPIIHTNLEKSEIISLSLNYLRNPSILQDRFPHDEAGSGKLIDGIYYYVFDEESTTKQIHEFIYNSN